MGASTLKPGLQAREALVRVGDVLLFASDGERDAELLMVAPGCEFDELPVADDDARDCEGARGRLWTEGLGPATVGIEGRGRDGCCQPPPAQIRTGGITAYGSCRES